MTSDFVEQVAKKFIDSPPQEWVIDDKNPNYEDFMEVVKSFIYSGYDKEWGFNLLFSNDYKRIRKSLAVEYKTLIVKKK